MNRHSIQFRFLHIVLALIPFTFISLALAQTGPVLIWSQPHGGGFSTHAAVAFSPDGQLLASGRANTNEVRIWNAACIEQVVRYVDGVPRLAGPGSVPSFPAGAART